MSLRSRLAKLEAGTRGNGCPRCRPRYSHFTDEGPTPERCDMCRSALVEVLEISEVLVEYDEHGNLVETPL
jgi:hypothetical protein